MPKIIILFLTTFLILPLAVSAGVGVGVNLGKIEIDEPLKPGGIYNFPSIGVLNTGDEPGEYELAVTYHQDQPELRPPQEWFSFSPSSFHLEPGASQSVAVKLSLPMKVKPGDYFAYLEAHPIIKAGPGTTIGVAAATKTYFTVIPANIWQAIYYKTTSFFTIYAPWTYVVLAMIGAAIIITIFRKFFAFQIGIRKK
ncbi:MAG: hypothetical protein A2667_00665 [Candidatus Wildermuthbacteria bacterium RIFCSPHIGHO2_01_FULL_47_27]|uniref:Uncharacterized protein n=1 Tax=Candidatus Wildermuthbacteria bacterium RIFCSPHIGHO2_02_FULL_47_17 TaxID=1802452 RepID=A0A1G2R4U3_9BACT|nr:MAG: hypothetical protein UY15_C0021G0013 [Parcubacteria group bacterium GW2011_GWA2_47_9]OHA64758.1 MAG: hypothetical protein A2667_00665 [Candidatus Wildermuthbacteria bacterium RIFCSPHIGHO2_01_FULL_47_27]OHA67399.1 MAG: hypothetical protein A3D59_01385 [Candidatus Wildermuthbacteria bacterium RIFCSPHIGHO2_02_FULL_47_17]OHA75547.1 MAG: hypothetical protein A3I38_03415 [Candidatus Wildermuthbacteria bacterium RIFCSPLOWO2_02_FULL_47_10]